MKCHNIKCMIYFQPVFVSITTQITCQLRTTPVLHIGRLNRSISAGKDLQIQSRNKLDQSYPLPEPLSHLHLTIACHGIMARIRTCFNTPGASCSKEGWFNPWLA